MVWTPSPPVNIPANSKLAQLVPFKAQVKLAKNEMRGEKGFGSTGQPEIYLAMDIGRRKPIVKIKIWNPKEPDRTYIKNMLLDTGADVTIFSESSWPQQRPLYCPAQGVMEVGGLSRVQQSTEIISCANKDGNCCTVRPYVAPIPLNLLGRDVLSQLNVKIFTERINEDF